ncbi:hypothetical protein EI94DRAFT_1728062 [Lactarius quietus]|nr:hypothetical protein EI94DRAFT_1728062 [Lactarius quietus]
MSTKLHTMYHLHLTPKAYCCLYRKMAIMTALWAYTDGPRMAVVYSTASVIAHLTRIVGTTATCISVYWTGRCYIVMPWVQKYSTSRDALCLAPVATHIPRAAQEPFECLSRCRAIVREGPCRCIIHAMISARYVFTASSLLSRVRLRPGLLPVIPIPNILPLSFLYQLHRTRTRRLVSPQCCDAFLERTAQHLSNCTENDVVIVDKLWAVAKRRTRLRTGATTINQLNR